MSRDPRAFEVVLRQTYEQNEDRIRVLSAALHGLDLLVSEHIWIGSLSPEGNERIREETFKSLIKGYLDNIADEQIIGHLDQIEAELDN